MNFDIMTKAMHSGAEFSNVTHFAEIFDNPLVSETEDGDPITSWEDLFWRSEWGGIFVPTTQQVSLKFKDDGSEGLVSDREFVAWQILHSSEYLIYYIINKVDGSDVARALYGDLDNDQPQSWNGIQLPEYWVSEAEQDWLNEYSTESIEKGLAFIKRCKQDKPIDFAFHIADCILNEDYGLIASQWYEADLSANIDDRSRYDDWSVKIMCVATGKFFVELEADCTEITITESKVYSYFVRNYDED
jgi:hypothetical protein